MPNIEESFSIPYDEAEIRTGDSRLLSEYLLQQNKDINKMYERIALGVNNTYEMTIISTSKTGVVSPPGQPLIMLPKIGMFYIMISGLEDNMPQRCSIIQKPIVGTAATETNLSNFTPASGTWNGVSLVIGFLTDQIGLGHDGGAALEGQFNVTILGQYDPEGGG